ncbi:MAG: hypothetical protein WCS03_15165 [Bacteroidota bacterium]
MLSPVAGVILVERGTPFDLTRRSRKLINGQDKIPAPYKNLKMCGERRAQGRELREKVKSEKRKAKSEK